MDQLFSPSHSSSLVVLAICFLMGSVPLHYLSARFFKNSGRGNKKEELVTALLDMAKGAGAVLLAASGLIPSAMGSMIPDADPSLQWGAAFFVVFGHCYRPWAHFKGGYGVATAFGAALVLSPVSALLGLSGYFMAYHAQRSTSLATLVGIILAAVSYVALNPVGIYSWIGAAMLFMILLKQEANLDALLENHDSA